MRSQEQFGSKPRCAVLNWLQIAFVFQSNKDDGAEAAAGFLSNAFIGLQ
jgi:hypothetical protein